MILIILDYTFNFIYKILFTIGQKNYYYVWPFDDELTCFLFSKLIFAEITN